MLNETHRLPAPDRATTRNHRPEHARVTVRLDAGAGQLARLTNLMAKLDIEPLRMEVVTSQAYDVLEARIDLGIDTFALERLVHRLSGLVGVRGVDRDTPA